MGQNTSQCTFDPTSQQKTVKQAKSYITQVIFQDNQGHSYQIQNKFCIMQIEEGMTARSVNVEMLSNILKHSSCY